MLFESVNLKENKILKSYANHIHMMPIRLSDERAVGLVLDPIPSIHTSYSLTLLQCICGPCRGHCLGCFHFGWGNLLMLDLRNKSAQIILTHQKQILHIQVKKSQVLYDMFLNCFFSIISAIVCVL